MKSSKATEADGPDPVGKHRADLARKTKTAPLGAEFARFSRETSAQRVVLRFRPRPIFFANCDRAWA